MKTSSPVWDDDAHKQIGARMREARSARGISLSAMAPRMGVGKAAIGHWETGTNAIKLPELWLYCALLGVSADKILFGVERWPFEKVSYEKVSDLEPQDRARIEGAMLAVASQLGVDIEAPAVTSAVDAFKAAIEQEAANARLLPSSGTPASEGPAASSPPRKPSQRA